MTKTGMEMTKSVLTSDEVVDEPALSITGEHTGEDADERLEERSP